MLFSRFLYGSVPCIEFLTYFFPAVIVEYVLVDQAISLIVPSAVEKRIKACPLQRLSVSSSSCS